MGPAVVVVCYLALFHNYRTDGRPSIRLEGQGVSGPPSPLLLAPSPNGAQLIRAGRRRRGRWPAITCEERGTDSAGWSPTVSTSWCGPRTPRTRPCLDRRRRYLRRQPERRGRSRGANSAVRGAPPRTAGPRSRAREPRPGTIRGDPGDPGEPAPTVHDNVVKRRCSADQPDKVWFPTSRNIVRVTGGCTDAPRSTRSPPGNPELDPGRPSSV